MNILKLAYHFSPKYVKHLGQKLNNKKVIAAARERQKVKVSKTHLEELFDLLEIKNDVFIHSSLMEIGRIEGGYKEIVRQINRTTLDKGHTLLVSALSNKGSSKEYLKNLKVFDVKTAPVEMGVINEYYALQPNAKRSLSPTHSVVAIGEKAEYYTGSHHLSETAFDENSPYFRIAENKGKILLIGAGLKHLTFNHVLEDLLADDFPVRVYTRKKYQIELINENNESSFSSFKAHSSYGGLIKSPDNVLSKIRRLPSTKIYSLGCSELILLDAIDVLICLLKLFKEGQSIYGKVKPTKKAIQKSDFWIQHFESLK